MTVRGRVASLPFLCLSFAAAAVAQSSAPGVHPLTAEVVGRFELHADPPLHMPTDVVVDAGGMVYVVDGVYARVVCFRADGSVESTIRAVGGVELVQPLTARIGPDGRLWIVDPGAARVVVRNPDGTLHRTITVPPDVLPQQPDLAGIALTRDGRFLWLADNNRHRLLRFSLETDHVRVFGQLGESLGQFHYPYALALTQQEELLVTDVLNGRIQRLNNDGVPTGSISGYGVDLGQLYRPKGVTVDALDTVWVADGALGVIQAFMTDGRLVGVLRSPDGEVLRFANPMGLTFDAAGDLYVVALRDHCVLKLRVTRNPAAPPPQRTDRRPSATIGSQARTCTVCHLEWVRPLVEGRSTVLADVPPNPPERPAVSRAEVCLSCHDGSVADSRRRVWLEHGHRRGVVPPPDMQVPPHLPLADGKIECRTCHSAHSFSESRTTVEEIVFLRVAESPAELCVQCHTAFGGGAAHGMHPLSPMPIEMPEALLHIDCDATRKNVTCLACHTGHGAQHDRMLVLDPNTNELCLECHVRIAPDAFAAERGMAHAHKPLLSPAQRATAEGFGTRVGPEGKLLCMTCHRSHNAPSTQHLLAYDSTARDACVACHPAQRDVVGSLHDVFLAGASSDADIPEVAVDAASPSDLAIPDAGACAGCHTAHRPAIAPRPSVVDPAGRCTACHDVGQMAAQRSLGDVNHPDTACTQCHNVHLTSHGKFLKTSPDALCRECHPSQAFVSGGVHDVTHNAVAWPDAAVTAEGTCLACHRPHGNEQTGLFRVGRAEGYAPGDDACIACHPGAAPDHAGPIALVHTRRAVNLPAPPHLPLGADDGELRLGCRTCHNPHSGADAATYLLRIPAGKTTENLCFECHPTRANIRTIGHAEEILRDAGFQVGGCRPCHATHNAPDRMEPRFLWSKDLDDFPGADEVFGPNLHCVACHRADGPVAPPSIAFHPDVEMFNPFSPSEEGYLPLFNARGEVDPNGRIACRTCHLTHGRDEPLSLPAGVLAVGTREVRARAWHVRALGPSNVCSTCHGIDAWRRFMYFHDAARRSGPITIPGVGRQ